MFSNIRVNTRGRAALLGSSAFFAMAVANPAMAQDAPAPATDYSIRALDRSEAVMEAQTGPRTVSILNQDDAILEAQDGSLLVEPTAPEPQVTIANPNTTTDARDPVNINGVAQMVVDSGGGSVGLCTGTLINPRTVIFAAHCVNSRPQSAYGANSGGTGIAFGFETNTRANAAGQTDELVRWLFGSGANAAGRFQTNIAQAFYNVNYVAYNQLSLEPAARTFLYGDVAVASLDTPAANIPTWALLFSPLTNTGTIGAAGTGFNVGITGYGNFGTGTSGVSSGDFRRRAAENILGALTDLQTFESFLFGGAPNGLTQNLYFLDFDDPLRGQAGASPFDFNAFRDNARQGTPGVLNGRSREGLTSNGDSGGPLILQNFTQQFVIGVLSGGYARFLTGGPANGYGTVSFYQPLYLYWDYIAANNPYHYVSATAGDGLWTDPNHWVTTLDPSYYILNAAGQPVNGIPNNPGEQKNGTSGDFGEICIQGPSRAYANPNLVISDCYDTRTGIETVTTTPIGTEGAEPADVATAENLPATASVTGYRDGVFSDAILEAQASGGATTQALPAATLANGLPGATNFVPNNADPVRTAGVLSTPRYFEVTLSAAGTTTLSGANITIDRLNITTAAAGLAISSGASLTSLINVNQFAGVNNVNGTLTSVGDYSFFGGNIRGTGTINTPFLTSVAGTFTPGGPGVVGTLTIAGNLVMASGSTLFINTNGNGVSSRLAVVATTFNAQGAPTNGIANVGGNVVLAPVPGQLIRAFDRYTILTAQGGVTGRFNAASPLSAILRPDILYTANQVDVLIRINPYRNVVNTASGVQVAFANLLDTVRGAGNNLLPLFDVLDQQNAATIQATLEALAPRTEALRTSIGIAALDNNSRLIRERTQGLHPGDLGGQVAYYGRRVQTAALNLAGLDSANATMSDVALETQMGEARLPETMSAFISAGYMTGDGQPLQGTLVPSPRDEFDGFYVAGGIETEIDENGVLGFALSYTNLDGTTGAGGGSVDGQLYAGNLYAKGNFGALYIDSQISAGILETSTERPGNLPGQTFTLRSNDNALALSAEVGAGAMFGDNIQFGPRVAMRTSWIDFSREVESGGPTAMVFSRGDYYSLQGRAGLVIDGVGRIRPRGSVTYVHDFNDRDTTFGANFVGSNLGGNAMFDLGSQDKDWFEVSGGIAVDVGRVELSVSADTTIERDDVRNQSYRASARIRF